jgi:hypothetical protein
MTIMYHQYEVKRLWQYRCTSEEIRKEIRKSIDILRRTKQDIEAWKDFVKAVQDYKEQEKNAG